MKKLFVFHLIYCGKILCTARANFKCLETNIQERDIVSLDKDSNVFSLREMARFRFADYWVQKMDCIVYPDINFYFVYLGKNMKPNIKTAKQFFFNFSQQQNSTTTKN